MRERERAFQVMELQKRGGGVYNIKFIWKAGLRGGYLKPDRENYLDPQTFLSVGELSSWERAVSTWGRFQK